jgi:hypothetical protein
MQSSRRPSPATVAMASLAFVWAAIAFPYTAVGPDDLEEYFTGVATTKLAIGALMQGAWPFWSADLGLGLPQPCGMR